MNLSAAQSTASASFLGRSFRILLGRPEDQGGDCPFVHPDVLWSACALGSACIKQAALDHPDLILLVPGEAIIGALQLCRSLRSEIATRSVRIAVWRPGLDQAERLSFYQAGADDIVIEPEIGSETIMRLTADARRSFADQPHVTFADLVLLPDHHLAMRGGKSISLSRFQLDLLEFLMQNPDRVLSRKDLADGLWNDRPIDFCSISTAINRLKNLLKIPGAPDLIHTVRGVGYVLHAN